MLALAILATVSMGAMFTLNNAEAKEVDAANHTPSSTPSSSIQSDSQKVNALLKKVTETNEKLETLDSRLSKESEMADLKKQVNEIEYSFGDTKKGAIDSALASLNNLIALTSLVIAILTVVLAVLAIFGFKGIKEVKQDIKQDIRDDVESLNQRHLGNINDLNQKHLGNINGIINKESSGLREYFDNNLGELANKVGTLEVAVRQMANDKNPGLLNAQTNQPESKGNAFDENGA